MWYVLGFQLRDQLDGDQLMILHWQEQNRPSHRMTTQFPVREIPLELWKTMTRVLHSTRVEDPTRFTYRELIRRAVLSVL